MTGFGKSKFETPEFQVKIELKCLNSKFSDIYCKIPKYLFSKEIEIRNLLTKELERGKIECLITMNQTKGGQELAEINQEIAISTFQKLKELKNFLGADLDDSALFIKSIDAAKIANEENQSDLDEEIEKLFPRIMEHVHLAVQEAIKFRKREGESVAIKLKEYIQKIESNLRLIEKEEKSRIPKIKNRIKSSVLDLIKKEDFDENRLEQEIIYYIEKLDITEEIVRLNTHLNYFLEIVEDGNGKKLNFISQEIGREINTIGSKANDSTLQKWVVEMKDELEKIKEQTANIV